MRLWAGIIGLTILAFAALASHQKKPFPLLVSASTTDAAAPTMPGVMLCKPVLYPRHAAPKQIVKV